jgi:hypothetical protein
VDGFLNWKYFMWAKRGKEREFTNLRRKDR